MPFCVVHRGVSCDGGPAECICCHKQKSAVLHAKATCTDLLLICTYSTVVNAVYVVMGGEAPDERKPILPATYLHTARYPVDKL